jgi:GR25 family glycosyltransferase involved in LPS biosynthesis
MVVAQGYYLVTENISSKSNELTGLSICLKKNNYSVVKIWNKNSKENTLSLLNENILGGWKYINPSTGMLFFYDEPIEPCIQNFMKNKYEALKWFKLNFNLENNRKLLANTVHKLTSLKYEDYLDGIMYINLENRKDRKEHILKEFEKAEIPEHLIHRIDAILNTTCGHLGCTMSHIKALEYAKKMNWKRFLILEDDVVFKYPKERILHIISEFFKKYENEWDILMLNTHWTDLIDIVEIPFIKKLVWGTLGTSYIVNSDYFDVLYDNIVKGKNLLYLQVEKWKLTNPGQKKFTTEYALDQYWASIQRSGKWYATYPYICHQNYALYSSTMTQS